MGTMLLVSALLWAAVPQQQVSTRGGDLELTVPASWKRLPHPDAELFLTAGSATVLVLARPLPWNASLSETLDAIVADSGRAVGSRKGHPFGERVVTSQGSIVWDSVFFLRRSFAWEIRHVRSTDDSSAAFDALVASVKLAGTPLLPTTIGFEPVVGRESLFVADAERLLAEVRPANSDGVYAYEGLNGAYVRGLFFLRLNDPGRAVAEFRKVLDGNPKLPLARALYAEALRRAPGNSREELEKNAVAALAEASSARLQDPSLAWPHLVMAQLERRRTKLDTGPGLAPESIEAVLAPLNTCLELPDPPAEAWRLRAEILESFKVDEAALHDFNRWLAATPTDKEARARRDRLAAALGKRPLGADPWSEGLRRYRFGDVAGALEAFTAAGDAPKVRRMRARASARVGDWGRVAAETTLLLIDAPDDVELRELRGFAFYRQGRFPAAGLDLEALLRLAPDRSAELAPYIDACRK